MLQGTCIDPDISSEFPETVYLFSNGPLNYYVSRFPNKNAHMGCFQKEKFKLIDDWPLEPPAIVPKLKHKQVYKANLIWTTKGYKNAGAEWKHCYVIAEDYQKNFTFFEDEKLAKLGGCFPAHWFTDYQLVELSSLEESFQMEVVEEEPANFEQMVLF